MPDIDDAWRCVEGDGETSHLFAVGHPRSLCGAVGRVHAGEVSSCLPDPRQRPAGKPFRRCCGACLRLHVARWAGVRAAVKAT